MIFLTGPHGSGKTESAKFLTGLGFASIDLGPMLRSIHRQKGSALSFGEWIGRGEELFGKDFTDSLLAQELKNLRMVVEVSRYLDIVVVGSRSRKGFEYLASAVPQVNGYGNRLVFIDGSFEALYYRYGLRQQRSISTADFQKLLDADVALGIESLRHTAEITIWNNGSLETLRNRLRYMVVEFGYHINE